MTEIWHRFEDRLVANYDPFEEYEQTGSHLEVTHFEFTVVKRTPKGVWLDYAGAKRFVLLSATKRFACPTIEEALESFRARKRKQAAIYRARAARADTAVIEAERLFSRLKEVA